MISRRVAVLAVTSTMLIAGGTAVASTPHSRAGAASARSASADRRVVLNDGSARPATSPRRVAVTGDGALLLDQLVWKHWGSPIATATGVIRIRNCRPACATSDHTYVYRVAVSAHQVAACRGGRRQYAFVRYDANVSTSFEHDLPALVRQRIIRGGDDTVGYDC